MQYLSIVVPWTENTLKHKWECFANQPKCWNYSKMKEDNYSRNFSKEIKNWQKQKFI